MGFITSIGDCCTTFLSSLPKAELPFIPALIMGVLCSFVIILLLYKRHYRTTMWKSFIHMMKDIFLTIPSTSHSEFMKCDNEGCVRCKKADNLKYTVIDSWKKIQNINKDDNEYLRIAESVRQLVSVNKVGENKNLKKEKKDKGSSNNQKPTIFKLELPSNPVWTDLECYEIEKQLLKVNMNVIQEEFAKLFEVFQNGNTYGWKLNHIPSGHWCIFPIIDQGEVNEENCSKCPNTSALLGSFPSLMKNCVFGNACFSLLYPDSHIEPHFGPTNLRLRCHFGLTIPNGCWLEVAGTQMRWKEGSSIIFDDSYQHSAYYAPQREFGKPRVILLLDFWHPNVSQKEKKILLQLLKPGELE